MAVLSSQDVIEFVKGVFERTPNFGDLTTRQLRNQYQEKMGYSVITDEDKDVFRSAVNTVFDEFTSESNLLSHTKKTSKHKGDDYMQKFPVKSIETSKQEMAQTSSELYRSINYTLKESAVERAVDVKLNVDNNCESTFNIKTKNGGQALSEIKSSKKMQQKINPNCLNEFSEHSESEEDSESEKVKKTVKSPALEVLLPHQSLKNISFQDTVSDSSDNESFCKSSENLKTFGNSNKVIFSSSSDDSYVKSDSDINVKTNRKRKRKIKKQNFLSDTKVKSCRKRNFEDSDDNEPFQSYKKGKTVRPKRKHTTHKSFQDKAKAQTKIERLKKYLRTASINIKNYSKVWEGCHTETSKAQKLLDLLHEAGLKGMHLYDTITFDDI